MCLLGRYDMSVKLKHDAQADRAFGWALEMWGWSMAAAKLNIKHKIIQKFQIEPSATWHQNVTVEDPYVFHYTFGHEYTKDGIPLIGVSWWRISTQRISTSLSVFRMDQCSIVRLYRIPRISRCDV